MAFEEQFDAVITQLGAKNFGQLSASDLIELEQQFRTIENLQQAGLNKRSTTKTPKNTKKPNINKKDFGVDEEMMSKILAAVFANPTATNATTAEESDIKEFANYLNQAAQKITQKPTATKFNTTDKPGAVTEATTIKPHVEESITAEKTTTETPAEATTYTSIFSRITNAASSVAKSVTNTASSVTSGATDILYTLGQTYHAAMLDPLAFEKFAIANNGLDEIPDTQHSFQERFLAATAAAMVSDDFSLLEEVLAQAQATALAQTDRPTQTSDDAQTPPSGIYSRLAVAVSHATKSVSDTLSTILQHSSEAADMFANDLTGFDEQASDDDLIQEAKGGNEPSDPLSMEEEEEEDEEKKQEKQKQQNPYDEEAGQTPAKNNKLNADNGNNIPYSEHPEGSDEEPEVEEEQKKDPYKETNKLGTFFYFFFGALGVIQALIFGILSAQSKATELGLKKGEGDDATFVPYDQWTAYQKQEVIIAAMQSTIANIPIGFHYNGDGAKNFYNKLIRPIFFGSSSKPSTWIQKFRSALFSKGLQKLGLVASIFIGLASAVSSYQMAQNAAKGWTDADLIQSRWFIYPMAGLQSISTFFTRQVSAYNLPSRIGQLTKLIPGRDNTVVQFSELLQDVLTYQPELIDYFRTSLELTVNYEGLAGDVTDLLNDAIEEFKAKYLLPPKEDDIDDTISAISGLNKSSPHSPQQLKVMKQFASASAVVEKAKRTNNENSIAAISAKSEIAEYQKNNPHEVEIYKNFKILEREKALLKIIYLFKLHVRNKTHPVTSALTTIGTCVFDILSIGATALVLFADIFPGLITFFANNAFWEGVNPTNNGAYKAFTYFSSGLAGVGTLALYSKSAIENFLWLHKHVMATKRELEAAIVSHASITIKDPRYWARILLVVSKAAVKFTAVAWLFVWLTGPSGRSMVANFDQYFGQYQDDVGAFWYNMARDFSALGAAICNHYSFVKLSEMVIEFVIQRYSRTIDWAHGYIRGKKLAVFELDKAKEDVGDFVKKLHADSHTHLSKEAHVETYYDIKKNTGEEITTRAGLPSGNLAGHLDHLVRKSTINEPRTTRNPNPKSHKFEQKQAEPPTGYVNRTTTPVFNNSNTLFAVYHHAGGENFTNEIEDQETNKETPEGRLTPGFDRSSN